MKISAKEFMDAFKKEWIVSVLPEKGPFADKHSWGKLIIEEGGLLERIVKHFTTYDSEMKFRKEFYKLDAVYVGGSNLYQGELNYPSGIHAIIEHEMGNDPEKEMWKLLHWRAPIKVLIFYDWAESEKISNGRKEWVLTKLDKFVRMRNEVNKFIQESPTVEYLFIVGRRNEIDSQLDHWVWATDTHTDPTTL